MSNNMDHVSDWQIEELLIDPAGPAAQAQLLHLEQCPLCSAKQERLEAAVLLYREAALIKAEDAFDRTPRGKDSMAIGKWRALSAYHLLWGWNARVLAALLLLAALVPAFVTREREHRQTPRAAENYVARQQVQDDLLLQQVDQEITESVPAPMQSLTQPLSDNGSEEP